MTNPLVTALKQIQQLALGPDRGSSAWQADMAHRIATDALAAYDVETRALRAQELRASGWKLREIGAELGVSAQRAAQLIGIR